MRIENGTGEVIYLKVDSTNRAWVRSIIASEILESSFRNEAFNINTEEITLNSDTESALIFIKNTNAFGKTLVVEAVFYLLGNSTGGSGDSRIVLLKNPTSGTIVDDAVETPIKGVRNFGSEENFDGIAYKGAIGKTFTNGSNYLTTRSGSTSQRIPIAADGLIIPKNKSLGIKYTPPTGNTSQVVEIAVACYYYEDV